MSVDVRSLLRLEEGLVHSDVYSSPEIFAMEMEKIFHRGWVYVGHESEIPNDGDFVLRWIGTHSVIMNRDAQGRVRLLLNRCRHRANSICQKEEGNASLFQCAYHGWTYDTTGALTGVMHKESAYPPAFDEKNLGLTQARVGIYRGFVWGNLAQDGISLDEHLGPLAKKAIDLACDASPEGELVLRQGCLKVVAHANWKFQGGDGYHPGIVHHANFMFLRAKRAGTQRINPLSIYGSIEEGYTARDLGQGHSCLDLRRANRDKLPDTEWAREYRARMVKTYGPERADILIRTGGNPHTIFAPNLQLVNFDVRVLRPIAADKVEIYFYPAFLKGAPDELNLLRLRDTEDRMGPAGSISPDDVDMFERNQLGMRQKTNPWKYMGRGLAREFVDSDEGTPEAYRLSGALTSHYSDETTQRAQLRWWADHLTQP